MSETWIVERLGRQSGWCRELIRKFRNDARIQWSTDFQGEIDNLAESLEFIVNFQTDGECEQFIADAGFELDSLYSGPPYQRLLVHLQVIEAALRGENMVMHHDFDYDAFVSHASEDKDDFVRPLVEELISRGLRIWYDEHALSVGDSLRQSIDNGLAKSRYAIVVISPSFLRKNWTQWELEGLVAKQMQGPKVILPVWYKVEHDAIISYSAPLANMLALNSRHLDIEHIASSLFLTIRGMRGRRSAE